MKILLGVDSANIYKPALNLALRFGFKDPHFVLANSVDTSFVQPFYGYPGDSDYSVEAITLMRQAGEKALERAAEEACKHNVHAETISLVGGAAPALIQLAEHDHCDLITVQSERKSALGCLFLGSVSRGLAIGAHHSVLISKGEQKASGDITAVFATDHSDYANRALDLLINWHPEHLTTVHVVSALDLTAFHDNLKAHEAAFTMEKTEEWAHQEFRRKTDNVVDKLRKAGCHAAGIVSQTTPTYAIKLGMEAFDADLLIMGAQGHGFIERLFIGSTSLHQVVSEPWSVLLLRP